MARKAALRVQREGTIINKISSAQEGRIKIAILSAIETARQEFKVSIIWHDQIFLKNIVAALKVAYPNVEFHHHLGTSSMRPDGGIVSIADHEGNLYPILVTEVKNQGTNKQRLDEGKPKQAKGNAIERLGKNVIGFRTWLLHEDIFPFVCFGDGCDFETASSILDRVTTINMFGPLNTFAVQRQGPKGEFQRGCMYFREEEWTVEEMTERVLEVMRFSIRYYKNKYHSTRFELEEEAV